MKKTKTLLLLLILTLFVGCSANKNNSVEEKEVVRIGVVGDSTNFIWDIVNENLKDENIVVKLESFSDGIYANVAQNEKELDLTAFQHYAFLNQEKSEKGYDFDAIGEMYVAPLNIFSDNIKNISELKKGDTILIPNNLTNAGRALVVLDRAGIIKIDDKQGDLPTISDVVENKLDIQIKEADPAMIIQMLPDVAAGITNAGIVQDTGRNPVEDAIFNLEIDPNDAAFAPYINIIVSRTEDKNNETYLKIVDAFHQENVKKAIVEEYKNVFIPVW